MEVKVNGQRVELGDSMPAITKKSIDINNPTTRFVDFTNKFILPDTNENRRILKHPKSLDSNSLDNFFNVSIFDVFQIFTGKGYLSETLKDKLSLQVVDDSKDLFLALDADLKTISWDDKDTELSTTAINALNANDITTCWHWGKLCLHENAIRANTDQVSGGGNDMCKYSRPSFNVQSFLKKAIEAQGYSYTESDIKLAFSGWHNEFFFTSYQKNYSATEYNPSGSLTLTGLDTNDFEHADITASSASIDIDTLKTKFRFRGTIESDALIDLIIRATDSVDSSKVTENKVSLNIGTNEVNFTTSDFQSDNGMDVEVILSGTGTVTMTGYLYTLHSDKEVANLSTNPFLGYRIKAYDNIPDMTFKDLFKLICTIGNQYQVVNVYEKTFNWGSLTKLNKLNAVDWSDKFIIGSESTTFQFPGLYQKNILKYNNDVTVKKEHGESYFNTVNKTLHSEGDYISLNFGASYDVAINSNLIGHAKVYSDDTRIADQELSIRLYWIDDDILRFQNINWNNLVSNYYESLFNSFSRVRVIECEMNLSKLDVLSWDEKQLVYIDYFKTTFIVLEITNFIPGRLTKVKLLAYGK